MDVLFNGTQPPFNDARVRRAVAHAVRRDEIVKAAFFGRGKPLEGLPIMEGTPWYDAELAHGWNYDPARPRRCSARLVSQRLYDDAARHSAIRHAQGHRRSGAAASRRHRHPVRIAAARLVDPGQPRHCAASTTWRSIGASSDNNDPDGLTVVLDTSLSPTHVRSFKVDAPRTIAALAKGRAEFDQAKRVEIYRDMQRAALEEVPLVGLAWRSQGYGMDKSVKGFTNLPGALTTSSGGMPGGDLFWVSRR